MKKLLKQPAFYDIFGLPVFAFIIGIAIWSLTTGESLPTWINVLLLAIGVLGIFVDGYIVYNKFVRKGTVKQKHLYSRQ